MSSDNRYGKGDGKEYLDNTPVSIPGGFRRPESIHDMIRRYIRSEQFAQKAQAAGVETEEEANDFEVEDSEDMMITRHEFAAMAGDEAMRLQHEEKLVKLRDAVKGAAKNGPSKDTAGDSSVGSVGKAGKGDGGAERVNSAGNRKAAARVAKPDDDEFAEQG